MANDALEDLAEAVYLELAAIQDQHGEAHDVHASSLPKIAASHFAGHFVTAGWANRCGLHAVALGTMRQAFEALTIVELGLVGTTARIQLDRWDQGKVTVGRLRHWLSDEVWPTYEMTMRDVTWVDFMSELGRALQPYAHFSSEMLQWNLNLVRPPSDDGPGLAAIGPGSYDYAKAVRIQTLRGVLLGTLGLLINEHATTPSSVAPRILDLWSEMEASEWFLGPDWAAHLVPHVW